MGERAVEELCAELIRFDTTNLGAGESRGEREAAEHVAAHLTDAGLTPTLLERSPRRSNVVARVPGTDSSLPPLLVHAHLDVVPADPTEWTVPPFAGEIRDGFVWGRGAVDMKDMCATLLTVLARWSAAGTAPRRDIVLAFVADEEDQGAWGAHWLVDEHRELFEDCAAAIGESGGYTVRASTAAGDPIRLYPVGTAERGTSHLRLTATGRAGHGSRRNDDNAVTKLVNALSSGPCTSPRRCAGSSTRRARPSASRSTSTTWTPLSAASAPPRRSSRTRSATAPPRRCCRRATR